MKRRGERDGKRTRKGRGGDEERYKKDDKMLGWNTTQIDLDICKTSGGG